MKQDFSAAKDRLDRTVTPYDLTRIVPRLVEYREFQL